MFMHGFVGRLGPGNRLVADTARDFLGAIQRGGETFAGFAHFFTGHVGGGDHQCAGVLGQLSNVIADCLCFFVHVFLFFGLLMFFNGKFSPATI